MTLYVVMKNGPNGEDLFLTRWHNGWDEDLGFARLFTADEVRFVLRELYGEGFALRVDLPREAA